MSYADMDRMKVIFENDIDIRRIVYKLMRGEAYVIQGENKFKLNIIASNYEGNLIEGKCVDEKNIDCDE